MPHPKWKDRARQTNLGRCLQTYRALSEISIRDLAPKIGISSATLMRIEHGYAMDASSLMKVLTWLMAHREESR